MTLSPLNFPWMGRNPRKLGAMVFLFALVLFFPLSVLAFTAHRPALVLLPLLGAAAVSVPIWVVSIWMRSCVKRLNDRLKPFEGECSLRSECVIVRGMIQQPGIVAIRGRALRLDSVFGKGMEIPLDQVRIASETNWFNGRLLFGTARGFWLSAGQNGRLGFAVQDADAWRAALATQPVRGD